ncbi:hypothetical protein OK016_12235 [Vibrio chagasii]|nr:hypothetical protein [Vibrio chagasii]
MLIILVVRELTASVLASGPREAVGSDLFGRGNELLLLLLCAWYSFGDGGLALTSSKPEW